MVATIEPSRPGVRAQAAGWPRPVADGVAYLRTGIVNVVFVGEPDAGDRGWVLVDAGLPGFAHAIASAAARRFGPGNRPRAIVLTHGHFDHVGTLASLARDWDVPVYAHDLELPYVTGRSPYPPPDPTVGGGLMASLAFLYPRGPIDLGDRVHRLPADGAVPGLPDWRWLPTPGHAPGHVSLFRQSDRTLIAGDAFVTVKQESAFAVLSQRAEVHGPPAYYTPDWEAARRSVGELAALSPRVTVTGHGLPMEGQALRDGLATLSRNFGRLAVPAHGRYVGHPATTDGQGVVAVPPDTSDHLPRLLAAFGLGVGLGFLYQRLFDNARGKG